MSELEQQIENRREKLARLAAAGIAPYPSSYAYDLEPDGVHAAHAGRTAEELEARPLALRVPGRVRALRRHGKTVFLDLHDGRRKLQVMVRVAALAADSATVLEHLDLGDYVGAAGTLIRTRAGELTLLADELVLLAKALRPLPEKWHGLSGVEARYRQRYLDLIANPQSRRVFETRAAIVGGLRTLLEERGFLEVETPMMQLMAGGATARPFVTHHNALDLELYLRVAPELFLKRLLVGGLHRVYEINRNFRNEGISTQHNPEFTMLEFYWAYADYHDLIALTERMISVLAQRVLGEPVITWQGRTIDLSPPWAKLSVRQAVTRYAGIEAARLEHVADLASVFRQRELPFPQVVGTSDHPVLTAPSRQAYEQLHPELEVPEGWYGRFLMELFEATAEEHLVEPTFIHGLPWEVSPLAKPSSEDPRFTDRFELYLGAMELANGFSELNDPELQAQRFLDQLRAREAGDDEAQRFDEEYILALEHGMPPAAGEGIGIDRLVMLFTDSPSIRDVILFPLLRPLAERSAADDDGA